MRTLAAGAERQFALELTQNYGVITGSGTVDVLTNSSWQNNRRIAAGGALIDGTTSSAVQNIGIVSADGAELEFGSPLSNTTSGQTAGQITLDDGTIRFALSNQNSDGLVNSGVLVSTGGTNDVFGQIANNSGGNISASNESVVTFHHNVINGGNAMFPGSTTVFLQNLSMSQGAACRQTLASADDKLVLAESSCRPCAERCDRATCRGFCPRALRHVSAIGVTISGSPLGRQLCRQAWRGNSTWGASG
jgi:hypothetical protein